MVGVVSCGEALISLLEQYEVDTIFGIPGVHTLTIYRGLIDSTIRHVLARNEAGAGFMADGYARATGKPGVCVVISGPGVTNAATPLGQAFGASVPMLLISSVNRSESLGKGWGDAHEILSQVSVTRPLTSLSATARSAADLPELLGRAFRIFCSERPRPVHIEIPIDVLEVPVRGTWLTVPPPERPQPDSAQVLEAAKLLAGAERPVLLIGGGSAEVDALTSVVDLLQAVVITSNAGKGAVSDMHPLSLGCTISRKATLEYLGTADVILAVGTELADADNFIDGLPINGKLIRIDIDSRKINDRYLADIGIVADAKEAIDALLCDLRHILSSSRIHHDPFGIDAIRERAQTPDIDVEEQHIKALGAIRSAMPMGSMLFADMAQISYTGCFAYSCESPGEWHFAGGFGALGAALPQAIGAKLGDPSRDVCALLGDGGVMFTVSELLVAVEEQLPLPVVIWDNYGFGEIRDEMVKRGMKTLAVQPRSPDFEMLARSFDCHFLLPSSLKELRDGIQSAFLANKPTIVQLCENSDFLT